MFGQLCWALRNRHGDAWLARCLEGYTANEPFLVVSDWFPTGYWPRPFFPSSHWVGQAESDAANRKLENANRKLEKKKIWFPREQWRRPLSEWSGLCRPEGAIWSSERKNLPQPHNAINRLTGTTGKDGFAPYQVKQTWFPVGATLEIWLVFDPDRLPERELEIALRDVGMIGFGRDASTGIGKFTLEGLQEESLPSHAQSDAWLTLGFCAPQGCGFDVDKSYYQIFTRFGRHGDRAAVTGQPFKQPVLLARAGAVLKPREPFARRQFVGQGVGGEGTSLSKAIPQTVQQGYAPVVGIWSE
ncbi:MAG: CRISPR-associated protein Csm7 [Magnetococcales bacterium]|nr:CRISPR-associated protein Csm7 [Magnetococcales bacterium]